MKYVVIDVHLGRVNRKLPFIFPGTLVHKNFAQAVRSFLEREYGCSTTVQSAGTVKSEDIQVSPTSGSDTLKIMSRPEDAELISNHDYDHGIY